MLHDFRERLITHAASTRLFDRLLDDLHDLGLLKRRGRQRTDSLAIHTRARRLNRMELVVETLRLAVQALVAADPAWSRATIPPTWKDGTIRVRFADDRCAGCPLRPRGCTGQGGRRLTISPGHAALVAARERQETAAFKTAYRAHRGGVEGCLSGLVRGQGIRVNRYIGRAKNHLRALFVGAGVNLRRAARWLAGERPKPRPNRLALALATG